MSQIKVDDIIQHDGQTWRVLSLGSVRDDGSVYAHLASTTQGVQQRNGFCPRQICDWINPAIEVAA
ncbi:MAG: hypothetical protein QM523_00025 [Candidatus Pacebacteria bacterium]|nr:hypothetical protein [Candidatus Paceibacterota bacterium]